MGVTIDLKKLNTMEKYIDVVDSILNSIQFKKELDELIKLIISVESEYGYFKKMNKNLYKEIALKIREFIKNLIFNGNLPDSNYLLLYVIFDGLNIETDDTLSPQISILKNSLNTLEHNSIEKMITNDIIFLMDILNTNTKDGLKRYLKEIMTFRTDLPFVKDIIKILHSFVDMLNLNFSDIAPLLDELFEKEFYLNLPYEKQRSICNWSLHVLYIIKNFFSTSKWTILYPKWKEIFYEYLKNEELDKAIYFQFYVYHFMGNSFQDNSEWKTFNEEINIPASKVYKEWGEKHSLSQPKKSINKSKKIRIALLMDRITLNSQFKVEFSILKALSQDTEFNKKYEIGIYSANYFEKNMDNQELVEAIKSLEIEVFNPVSKFIQDNYYNSHLDKALKLRETFIQDEIDILITNMNGQGINTFLLSTRCAPKQVYFSHGEYYFNIDGIDDRFVMGTVDKAEEQIINGFKFYVYKNIVDIDFLNPKLNMEHLKEIEDIKSKYPKNTIFLGTIGRLVKLDNRDYIKTILEILKEYENTIYFACGEGGEVKLQELLKEVNSEVKLENLKERFILTGLINAHIYGNIIDIFLNTFPHSQGTSIFEIMAKEKAVISMYLENWEEVNKLMPKEIMAHNTKEYKELAIKVIEDKEFYSKVAKACKDVAMYYVDYETTSKTLIDIFDKISND